MANASEALDSTRVYLNDVGKQIWTDVKLLPYLKEAYRDLLVELWLNGIPIVREKADAITVTTGLTELPSLPSDMVEPIKLKERLSGSSDRYADMWEKNFTPDYDQGTTLRYWAWREGVIELVGATTERQVLLFYWKSLTIPTAEGNALGFVYAEIYLGPKTAAYAAASVGGLTLAREVWDVAESKLDKIIRANIKGQQALPTRRMPYGTSRRRLTIF